MADQTLPHAQQEAFRGLAKAYETQSYKKGLKLADGILRTCPEHGETLAMKGLTLNAQEKKDEGLELIRRGLRNNIGSSTSWHVLGLFHRSQQQYRQAIKCYLNALRLDNGNPRIMHDLGMLQVQVHDVHGFTDTMLGVLQIKPAVKANWIAVAIGSHLKGDHERAITIIDTYLQNELQGNGGEPLPLSYEGSELQLFRNDMLVEQGLFAEALAHLDEKEGVIVDRYAFVQRRGRLLLLLGRFDEARQAYREHLVRGPDNWHTHLGFQAAVLGRDCGEPVALRLPSNSGELSDEDKAKLVEAYAELAQAFPRSVSVQRIALNLFSADSDEFRTRATAYLRARITKGVPSLFVDLRDLYGASAEPADLAANPYVAAIGDIVQGFVASLEGCGRFPNTEEGELEPPSSLLWAKYFLVQHHDKLGDVATALRLLDECQTHTPTLVDLFQRRARVLKHGGDLRAAAQLMDAGRELDLSDRYSNNKATKYLLRADQVEQAEETIGLFTKHNGEPMQQLHDVQVLWFELEHGESSLRQGDYGYALKMFLEVVKHYGEFREDQFDFHGYCMRKVTLRAYVATLKATEKLKGQELYCRAAKGAIQTYLALHAAQREEGAAVSDEALEGMTAGEKKKAKAKARKEAKAREEEEARVAAEEAKEAEARAADARRRGGRVPAVVDLDPHGRQLTKVDALAEAQRLVSELQQHAASSVWTHLLAYDVARKRGKWLQALRAVVRARAAGGEDHPEAFVRTVEFLRDAAAARESFSHAVDAVVQAETADITHGQSLELFVNDYHRHHGERMPQRLAAGRALFMALPSAHARAVSWATELSGREVTLTSCVAAHSALASLGASAEEEGAFKAACATKFPLSTYFNGEGAAERAGGTSTGREAVGEIQ